jgi:hypothetical protein
MTRGACWYAPAQAADHAMAPNIPLAAAQYRITIYGTIAWRGSAGAFADIAVNRGEIILAHTYLVQYDTSNESF